MYFNHPPPHIYINTTLLIPILSPPSPPNLHYHHPPPLPTLSRSSHTYTITILLPIPTLSPSSSPYLHYHHPPPHTYTITILLPYLHYHHPPIPTLSPSSSPTYTITILLPIPTLSPSSSPYLHYHHPPPHTYTITILLPIPTLTVTEYVSVDIVKCLTPLHHNDMLSYHVTCHLAVIYSPGHHDTRELLQAYPEYYQGLHHAVPLRLSLPGGLQFKVYNTFVIPPPTIFSSSH